MGMEIPFSILPNMKKIVAEIILYLFYGLPNMYTW